VSTPRDVQAAEDEMREAPGDYLARAEAEMEAKYAHQDVQFEPYDGRGGAGRLWMTDLQLERAATRLAMKTRLAGDNRNGGSDQGTDAALVADAYLKRMRQDKEAHDIIHRAAELFKTNPPRPKVDLTN
jgi:hypothetical protein